MSSKRNLVQNDDNITYESPKVDESKIEPPPIVYRSLDPEFIVSAMEELKEFATYHFLPLVEHLTSDHIESFLHSALVKPSS